MTIGQKREIEEKLNSLDESVVDGAVIEMLGIKFTLDVLGYWACPTENGYTIRRK